MQLLDGHGAREEASKVLLCCGGGSHSHPSLNVSSPFLTAVLIRIIKVGRELSALLFQPHPIPVLYKEESKDKLGKHRRGETLSSDQREG